MTMHEKMKRHISHAAFLPMSQFNDSDSLARLRPGSGFSYLTKIAMLVHITYGLRDEDVDDFAAEEDMNLLDSVDDFVAYLQKRGIMDVADPLPSEGIK